jgi:hypothetical protein
MNTDKRSIDDILLLICDFLNEKNIPYVVVGGMAVLVYGNLRTTMDVDIIVQLKAEDIGNLTHFLEKKDFFASEDDLRSALRERSHCTVEDKSSMIRLDIKGIYTESDKRSLERRKCMEWRGKTICVSSPEDLIGNKLLFGSEQDIKDAEGIWVRQKGNLDMEYLEGNCRSLGVWDDFIEMKNRIEKYLKEIEKREEKRLKERD